MSSVAVRTGAALLSLALLGPVALSTPASAGSSGAAPVARPDRLGVNEDTQIVFLAPGVLLNDRHPDGQRLTARMVRGPRHGRARLRADGRLVYTPQRNWSGRDRLVYVARDPAGRRDRARVVIVVRPVNDAPSLSFTLATPVREHSAAAVTVTARDPEGDPITYLFDCDGEPGFETRQDSPQHDCHFGEQGRTTLRLRVVDDRGAARTTSYRVRVRNQPPVVALPEDGPAGPAGQALAVDLGSFVDPGLLDGPWTATVDWGDGTSEVVGSFATPGALGTLVHTWAEGGLYQVRVTVTEDGGASGSSFTYAYVS